MCLKSLAGKISVHGNLEDDKILYRELLSPEYQGEQGLLSQHLAASMSYMD